tara:strand:+ start:843 stop:1409 length:567 start_codon:yes stop_codon:yes gene_type:complete
MTKISNTTFTSAEERYAVTSDDTKAKWHAKLDKYRDNARNKTTFGGKRFLGHTKKGVEVWASYTIDKETKDIQIKTTHNLNALRDNSARLAPRRVTTANNTAYSGDLNAVSGRDHGRVTEKTLEYIETLIDFAAMGVGKVNGECSRQLFLYVSNSIYEGGTDLAKDECRWSDIIDTWDLPSGQYFTVY